MTFGILLFEILTFYVSPFEILTFYIGFEILTLTMGTFEILTLQDIKILTFAFLTFLHLIFSRDFEIFTLHTGPPLSKPYKWSLSSPPSPLLFCKIAISQVLQSPMIKIIIGIVLKKIDVKINYQKISLGFFATAHTYMCTIMPGDCTEYMKQVSLSIHYSSTKHWRSDENILTYLIG